MIEPRESLINALHSYSSSFPEEEDFKTKFLQLLDHPRSFHRDHLPGHITGSAWIVNNNFSKVLLVHHAKLGRWLQPGGHADEDEHALNIALREAEEETGLNSITLITPSIFDIDIHVIPRLRETLRRGRPARNNFPEHLHYDVRFLLQASENDLLMISDESSDMRWFHLNELAALTENATSIMRMVYKTLNLPGQ